VTRLTYADALDEALCFGWIDGQASPRDQESYRQRFTPRRPRSAWSARNVERIGRLEREGRMQTSGRAAVERARADGQWNRAYASPSQAKVPEDLARALKEDAKASAAFEGLNAANRYAILYRLETAKKADTRARRLETCVEMLRRNETFHPRGRSGRKTADAPVFTLDTRWCPSVTSSPAASMHEGGTVVSDFRHVAAFRYDALHPMALDAAVAYVGDETPESAESLPVARVQGRLYLNVRHPRTPEAIRLVREHGSDGDFARGVVTLLNYFPGAVEPFPAGTQYAGWPKESEPTAQA
jgi:uncharacterized protein YdeI (YjbR/CyaY-like superfamily)